MKRLVSISAFCFLLSAFAGAQFFTRTLAFRGAGAVVPPAGTSYTLSENFETPDTGYENTWGTWSSSGTITPTQSTSGLSLEANQCLKLVMVNGKTFATNILSSSLPTGDVYTLLRWGQVPTAITGRPFISFWSNGTNLCRVFIRQSTRTLWVVLAGTASADSVGTMAINVTYHCWMHYESGLASFAWSTDGTRPVSGNNYIERTGAATDSALVVRLGQDQADTDATIYYDKVRVAVSLGDNPP